jgi:hypothetical protein
MAHRMLRPRVVVSCGVDSDFGILSMSWCGPEHRWHKITPLNCAVREVVWQSAHAPLCVVSFTMVNAPVIKAAPIAGSQCSRQGPATGGSTVRGSIPAMAMAAAAATYASSSQPLQSSCNTAAVKFSGSQMIRVSRIDELDYYCSTTGSVICR